MKFLNNIYYLKNLEIHNLKSPLTNLILISTALNLDHKIGNFDVGKDFDALLIDVYSKKGQVDKYEGALPTTTEEYAVELLQKFIFVGDDRNIAQVYVKGEKVKDTL